MVVLLGMGHGCRKGSRLGMAQAGSGLDLVASLLGGWEMSVMEGTAQGNIFFDGPASILIISIASSLLISILA